MLEERIAELVDRLGAEDPGVADAAAHELAGYGALAAWALADALRGGWFVFGFPLDEVMDPAAERRRERAERTLARIGPEAAAPAAEALRSRRRRVRRSAARVLARLGDPGISALTEALGLRRARSAARRELAAVGGAAVPALAGFMRRARRESAAWHAADAALCRIVGAPTLRQVRGGATPTATVAAGLSCAVFALVAAVGWSAGATVEGALAAGVAIAYCVCGAVLLRDTPLGELDYQLQVLATLRAADLLVLAGDPGGEEGGAPAARAKVPVRPLSGSTRSRRPSPGAGRGFFVGMRRIHGLSRRAAGRRSTGEERRSHHPA